MDDLDLMLEMQEAELRVLDIPTYEAKHGGPGVHSTGSPQAVHASAIAGRGRGGRFISKRAAEAFESGARPDAMGRPVRPGSASGTAQGKGPSATPGEIASALANWDAISGDKKALANRLEGWTHSRRRTAEALRDSRAAGETDFDGGADRRAGELFERIEGNRRSNNYTADQIRKAELTANTPVTPPDAKPTIRKGNETGGSDDWATNRDGRSYLETADGYKAFVEPDDDAEDRWFVDLVDADGNEVLSTTAGGPGEGRRAVDRALADARRPKPKPKPKPAPRTPSPAPEPPAPKPEPRRASTVDMTEAERDFDASLAELAYEGWVPEGYTARMLVRARAESIRRDLREEPNAEYVTIKVPSGTEVEMRASLARHLLSLKGVAFVYDMETKAWREADHPRDPRNGRFIEKGGGLPDIDVTPESPVGVDWTPDAILSGRRRRMRDGDPRKDDPAYHRKTVEIERRIERALSRGDDTETVYDKIDGVPGKYRAERERQQLEVIDEFVNADGVKADKRMLFLGGLPGAGKTTWLNSDKAKALGIDLGEYVQVNPDEVKTVMQRKGMVPDFDGLSADEAATLYHEESTHIAKMIAEAATAQGKNVVFDTSLAKQKQWDRARELTEPRGYDSTLVFIDVPVELSMQRAARRHKKPGRYIPYDLIEGNARDDEYGSQNRFQFEYVKDQAGRWVHVDNANDGAIVASSGV